MKRIFICLASLLMIFSFSSCGKQKSESKKISLPRNTQVSFSENETKYVFILDYDNAGKAFIKISEPERIRGLSFTESEDGLYVKYKELETEYPVARIENNSPVCRFLRCADIMKISTPQSSKRQGNKAVYYYFFNNTGFEITTLDDKTVSLKTDNIVFEFL